MTGRAWRPPDGGPVRWRNNPVLGWLGYVPSRAYRTWGGGRAYGLTAPGHPGPRGGRRHRPGPGARHWYARARELPGVAWWKVWWAERQGDAGARAYLWAMARCGDGLRRCDDCGTEWDERGCGCIPF